MTPPTEEQRGEIVKRLASFIRVVESPLLRADRFGHYIGGVIYTHSKDRLVSNIENLGIDRKTGEVRLLPGKVAV